MLNRFGSIPEEAISPWGGMPKECIKLHNYKSSARSRWQGRAAWTTSLIIDLPTNLLAVADEEEKSAVTSVIGPEPSHVLMLQASAVRRTPDVAMRGHQGGA